jgi:hypothetical protein
MWIGEPRRRSILYAGPRRRQIHDLWSRPGGIVGDAESLHLRWANLPIPVAIAKQIEKYTVSVIITNSDNYTPFLAFEIGDTPNVSVPVISPR